VYQIHTIGIFLVTELEQVSVKINQKGLSNKLVRKLSLSTPGRHIRDSRAIAPLILNLDTNGGKTHNKDTGETLFYFLEQCWRGMVHA